MLFILVTRVGRAGAEKFVLIETTIDGDYVRVFKSFDELRKYIKDMYGIEIELE